MQGNALAHRRASLAIAVAHRGADMQRETKMAILFADVSGSTELYDTPVSYTHLTLPTSDLV